MTEQLQATSLEKQPEPLDDHSVGALWGLRRSHTTCSFLCSGDTNGRNILARLYRLPLVARFRVYLKAGRTAARQMRSFVRRLISLRDHNVK